MSRRVSVDDHSRTRAREIAVRLFPEPEPGAPQTVRPAAAADPAPSVGAHDDMAWDEV
jgi:hypothetical protein